MSTGIEKFRTEERFRLAWLKHRGNVLAVCKELNYPLELGEKYASKIKRRADRNVAYGVAQTIMMQILFGYESRIHHLQTTLLSLEKYDEYYISCCCEAPVDFTKKRRKRNFHCTKCKELCNIKCARSTQILSIKYETIRLLREEDSAMVDFAQRMGYVNPDAPVPVMTRNQFLVINPQDKQVQQDNTFVNDVEKLPPMEREKLRKSVEAHIVNNGGTKK